MSRGPLLAAALVLLGAGAVVGRASAPSPGVEVRFDTVEVESWALLEEVERLELEVDGWRNRWAGRRQVDPEVVYVARDVVGPPPACQLTLRIDDGRLTATPLTQVEDSTGSLAYRPRLLDGLDVTRCDDGLSVSPEGVVVCDQPALGHLSVLGEAGTSGSDPWAWAGMEWTPYWRSALRARLGARAWPGGLTWDLGASYRFFGLW